MCSRNHRYRSLIHSPYRVKWVRMNNGVKVLILKGEVALSKLEMGE